MHAYWKWFARLSAILAVAFLPPPAEGAETRAAIWRLLSLNDYNTRIVLFGAGLLGLACGLVGVFLVLRKRALLGDAISHSTLPGIAAAFLVMVAAGGDGKYMPGLLLGAALSALLGMAVIHLVRTTTRLPQDAALGIVLSVFFGAGVALLGVIQKSSAASAAGLETFIYGKTASMLAEDGRRIAFCAGILTALCALLFKEFRALSFDEDFTRAQGWPIRRLDALMMLMVLAVTVIGLQAVGLILVIALLIIPPVAARFWTERLSAMVALSAGFGASAALAGAALSSLYPDLPAGAMIVLMATGLFVASLLLGRQRGLLIRWRAHALLESRIDRQNVLRSLFELAERDGGPAVVDLATLHRIRHWRGRRLSRALQRLVREDLVREVPGGWRLTPDGMEDARRIVRNHRLWELYLIHHADIAPSHVDREADLIEHVLGRAMVEELERLLAAEPRVEPIPVSPHPIGKGMGGDVA